MKGSAMTPGFDEMHAGEQALREHYRSFDRWLRAQPPELTCCVSATKSVVAVLAVVMSSVLSGAARHPLVP